MKINFYQSRRFISEVGGSVKNREAAIWKFSSLVFANMEEKGELKPSLASEFGEFVFLVNLSIRTCPNAFFTVTH